MQVFFALLFSLSLFISPLTHDLHLAGIVYFEDVSNQDNVEGLCFFVKSNKQIIALDIVDENGRYDFDVPNEKMGVDLSFYFTGNGFDTTFVRSISQFESDICTVNFQLD
ncbi:MAG: hypothetical protein GQ574_09915 [Crocinitomix sp.]|nr:hypothetical protein [Crocinitomix sp.]